MTTFIHFGATNPMRWPFIYDQLRLEFLHSSIGELKHALQSLDCSLSTYSIYFCHE